MKLADLSTPCALLDETRMSHNIARMQQRIDALGVSLRPHVKTAKCIAVAQRQRDAGARGITVSTLKEAEQFFAAGFSDILYAVCIAPTKLAAAQALCERGCRLMVVVDSVAAASAIVATGHAFEVMIEIDTDGYRAGVLPDSDLLLEIGSTLHDGRALLRGVMTHAGASYECRTPQALQAMAEQERIVSRRDGQVPGDLATQFPVGTRLRILPNHACATAAQFSQYEVLAADGSLQAWPRFNGW